MKSGLSIVVFVSLLSIFATNPSVLFAILSETPDQLTELNSSSESEDTYSSINYIPGILQLPVEDIGRTTNSITLPPAMKRLDEDTPRPRIGYLLFGKRNDRESDDRSPTATPAGPVFSDVQFEEDRYAAVGACDRAHFVCRDWWQQCDVQLMNK